MWWTPPGWSRQSRLTICAKASNGRTHRLNRLGRKRSKRESMKERFDGLIEHLIAGNVFLQDAVEILERSMIQRALEANAGNQCAASKQLGIHRNTLQRKVREYGLGKGAPRKKPAGRTRSVRTTRRSS